ncbi:hypothetical protein SAMN05216439_1579 [Methanobrevibacter gottschalkii]|uniref:Uncharacterized protein n=2 Tax=Methanobrevibacter gottschalkii TaxID=190974 RepID=A0A3N5C2R0_9EURY|nr:MULTISPECIES: hypothetical protein [Methanobrevibacter]MCQ2971314.1 hypothetical protein [archaeon]RPF50451.1 hypothetical protein EDC42_1729 [Methanobrevibacter gottschalkii DSM 11977]SEK86050.1 hypothetical protein SAMN05216439_1579 [Methanobrevibacter gottschalkii]
MKLFKTEITVLGNENTKGLALNGRCSHGKFQDMLENMNYYLEKIHNI